LLRMMALADQWLVRHAETLTLSQPDFQQHQTYDSGHYNPCCTR
jgi:hypothetical protein